MFTKYEQRIKDFELTISLKNISITHFYLKYFKVHIIKKNYFFNKLFPNKMIEKVFMQTWKNRDIPDIWRKSKPSVEKHMKFYEYHLMTDKDNINFVRKYFPDFYSTFIDFKYNIMRADAIRYMWLYIKGGIYMDLDFYFKKDISELIDKTKKLVFLEYESVSGKKITNSLIMSQKKHPLWLMVIDEMKKPKPFQFLKCQEVYQTTGPYFLSDVIKKYIKKYGDNDIQILKFEKIVTGENQKDTYKYLQAVEGRSWHGALEKIGVSIHQNYMFFVLVFIVFIVFILIVFFLFL